IKITLPLITLLTNSSLSPAQTISTTSSSGFALRLRSSTDGSLGSAAANRRVVIAAHTQIGRYSSTQVCSIFGLPVEEGLEE
ncbi:hypothetical protein LINPERHAP2_LOCUS24982, partial [Linum perenne]